MTNTPPRPNILLRSHLFLLFVALPILFFLTMRHGWANSTATPEQRSMAVGTQRQAPDQIQSTSAGQEIIRGLLLSLPVSGLGLWEVRTSDLLTRSVLVLNLNVLEDGLLPAGSWVYIDAEIQLDLLGLEVLVATHLRLDDYEPGEVVARLANGVYSSTIASRYDLTPKSTVLASGNIYLFTTTQPDDDVPALAQQMETDPDIVWAEPNYIGSTPEGNPYRTWRWGGPEPSGYHNQAAFAQVNLSPALAHYQGDQVIVALLDTGIDFDHPVLAGHWLPGYDMVADDAQPQDEGPGGGWGHGTHVAGIIAYIAPHSTLLPLRVLDSDGRGDIFTLAYAIEWAIDPNGDGDFADQVDVINLSLGTDYNSDVLHEKIEQAQAQGIIVVAAAGNENANTPLYPVAYAGVIGVAALDAANHRAEFSNYGAWVELAAPGVGVTSTIIGPEGSGYASWSGTSMATAFVSGAAALVRQKFPISSTAEITQLLTGYARDLDADNPSYIGQLGGLLDIGAALVEEATPTATDTPSPTPSQPTDTPAATTTGPAPVGTPIPTATEPALEGTPASTQTATPTATPTPTGLATATITPKPTSDLAETEGGLIYLPLVDR